MVDQPSAPLKSNLLPENVAEEFLEILVQAEECYPWNPAAPEAEGYFTAIEAQFSLLEGLDEEEIATRAETFFSQLTQGWPRTPSPRVALLQQFGNLMPAGWLEQMLDRAEHLVTENLSPLDRAVACIQPLWSNWTEADLQVFARPILCAMRGTPPVRQAPWEELSQIEQIRLTLAVAGEMLEKLPGETSRP